MIYLNSPNVEIFFVEFIESPHLFLIVQIPSFFTFLFYGKNSTDLFQRRPEKNKIFFVIHFIF